MKEIQEHKIKIYEFPDTEDDEDNKLIRKIKASDHKVGVKLDEMTSNWAQQEVGESQTATEQRTSISSTPSIPFLHARLLHCITLQLI